MNGGKPMNVRCSTTLKSERLTDAQCVDRLQTGITKAVIEIKLLPDTKRVMKGLSRM
jgi:hypothetical protein